jgi:hypothetical protein
VCDLWLQIGFCLPGRILRAHPLGILIMPSPAVESKQNMQKGLRCDSRLQIDPALFGGGADAFGKIPKLPPTSGQAKRQSCQSADRRAASPI